MEVQSEVGEVSRRSEGVWAQFRSKGREEEREFEGVGWGRGCKASKCDAANPNEAAHVRRAYLFLTQFAPGRGLQGVYG